jgi:hypothetical protein
MTRDDIIRMARECGLVDVSERDDFDIWVRGQIEVIDIESFAALVAAAEREACAKLCAEDGLLWGKRYAAAIRARGEK